MKLPLSTFYKENTVRNIFLSVIAMVALLAALAIPGTALAQSWEELPESGTTLDFSGIFNEKAASFGGRAIHAGEKYWLGIQGSQITGEDEVLSQDLSGRVQGGFSALFGIDVQGFIEADYDMELTVATGAYLRKVLAFKKLKLVLGAGSMFEGEEALADAGLNETEVTVLPYWLTIVGAEYDLTETVDFYGKIIGQPEINLSTFKGSLDVGVDVVLRSNLTLKIQSISEIAVQGNGVELSDTENSILLSLNL